MRLKETTAKRAAEVRAVLWSVGYIVIDQVLGDKGIQAVMDAAAPLNYVPIFNRIYEVDNNDNKRLMARINLEETPFNERLTRSLQTIYPNWELHKWTIIKSLPGGMQQDVHRDFPTFETAEALKVKGWVQASLFIALEDKTQLDVFPAGFTGTVRESTRTRVQIPKGSMIIFRGDLPHTGISYDAEHIRLHCYLRVRGIEQKDDATEAVPMDKEICFHCIGIYEDKKTRNDHTRYCKANPKKEEIAETGKRKNDEGAVCEECGE